MDLYNDIISLFLFLFTFIKKKYVLEKNNIYKTYK